MLTTIIVGMVVYLVTLLVCTVTVGPIMMASFKMKAEDASVLVKIISIVLSLFLIMSMFGE